MGLALHEFDTDGTRTRSFQQYPMAQGRPYDFRALAAGPTGIWSVTYAYRYEIHLAGESGERVFKRQPDWYRPYKDYRVATPEQPPDPLMTGIWEDGENRVWTVGLTAAPDYADWLGEFIPGEEVYQSDPGKMYDGVIEVLDVETGELIASASITEAPIAVVAPGVIALTRSDQYGWWYADLFRVSLVQP